MSWYEDWFDSPLYEFLYASRNEKEANKLADLIEQYFPHKKFRKIVDVGCGRGRHSISLAERGYHVTGLDLSPQAIEKAKKIAAERNLENVEFMVQDMREPLENRFDGAVNLFTTFGYFLDVDENRKVLKSISQMLKRDGRFLIDYMNAVKVEKELVPEEIGSHRGVNYHIKRYIRDGCVYKEIEFSGERLDKPRKYTERVQLFDREWLEDGLQQAGFSVKSEFGDYEGGAFNAEYSPRLIILADKTK